MNYRGVNPLKKSMNYRGVNPLKRSADLIFWNPLIKSANYKEVNLQSLGAGSKGVKILLGQGLETDGIRVFKDGRLFFDFRRGFASQRFSLLILYARNFEIDNLKRILYNFSFDYISDTTVVLGSLSDLIKVKKELKDTNIKAAIANDPSDVLYTSLKVGLRTVSQRSDFVILHFGSLPNVDKGTVELICKKAFSCDARILIPTFKGNKGHPIVFEKSLMKDFLLLRKEKGLPYLLKKFNKETFFIEVNDSGILRNIR